MIGRFINADDISTISADLENFTQYNLYAYCFNNPANLTDGEGAWPDWATKVAIGTAAMGAASGALTASVSHRITTGSWKGVGKAALNGAADGSGRNSQFAVYKSGLTKLRNGTASRMSAKVIKKGITSSIVGGFYLDGYYGTKQAVYQKIKNWLKKR